MVDHVSSLNAALEGRYRIVRELGEGGMATVYLAEDLRHERQVALKVLRPELAAVVGTERFLAEIKTTANLQHPHILPLFDSGEAGGFLFYVMPHIEGESLRDRLDREHQLPVDEALRIALEIAEALAYAHEQGVIHRDIKPANILLVRGSPLVADFGIALALSAAGAHRLTETGLSLGTPHYMSPEQATGETVGPTSDVYSLGCVLYEMLVGEPPHTANTPQGVLGKVISTYPEPVRAHRRSVPLHVEASVARALEKLPADRFRSAAEFGDALRDEGFRHGAGASGGATSRPNALTIAGWGLAAVFGGLWLASTLTPDAERPVRSFSIAPGVDESPTEWLALAPDGSALVLNDGAAESHVLVVKRFDDLVHVALQGSEGAWDPVVSPDGQTVAFMNESGLLSAPITGGSARTLVEGSPCCARWASDGFLYYTDYERGSIHRVRASGGEPELVLEPSLDELFAYYQPLPTSDRAVVGVESDGRHRIEIVDAGDGRREVLTDGVRPFVTDDGYLVFAREGGGLFAAAVDDRAMSLAGSPMQVAEDIGYLDFGDAMFALSASGDLVYWHVPVDETVRELAWVDRSGVGESADPEWTGDFESVEISPDGTRAVVTRGSVENTEIWLKELDRGPARRLTFVEGLNRRPVWAPDGTTILFISDRGGRRAAYSLPVDGIGSPELLLELPDADIDEVLWSPGGEWLIYRTGTTVGTRDIYARRLVPDTATMVVSALPEVDELAPSISPNGRWLAYVSDESGQDEIWVRPFPDVGAGRRQISPDGGNEPVWGPDGRELLYRRGPRVFSVEVETGGDFSTGQVRELFDSADYLNFTPHHAYSVDPTQDRLLMIRTQPFGPELILVQNFVEELRGRLPN